MLTIGQLASYAGVTVRTVRHYHAKGLLPEPERDHSGYRRYDAAAVVELVRIRTLADAGVPLSRVRELLGAREEEFADAVESIDRRLRAVEDKVKGAMDAAWRRTAPADNPLLAQMREQVAEAEQRLARAQAAGDAKRVKEAEKTLESKRQFLAMAEGAS